MQEGPKEIQDMPEDMLETTRRFILFNFGSDSDVSKFLEEGKWSLVESAIDEWEKGDSMPLTLDSKDDLEIVRTELALAKVDFPEVEY